jgi:MATE family multidrug resistance protein
VRRAGYVAVALSGIFMSVMTLAVILARFEIAELFLGEASDTTAQLTAALLMIGATFFIADGVQTTTAGALRGMSDTKVPLLFATISYWLVGFASAYALAFLVKLGAAGVWIGLSLGTVVYAALLILRFRLLARRMAI